MDQMAGHQFQSGGISIQTGNEVVQVVVINRLPCRRKESTRKLAALRGVQRSEAMNTLPTRWQHSRLMQCEYDSPVLKGGNQFINAFDIFNIVAVFKTDTFTEKLEPEAYRAELLRTYKDARLTAVLSSPDHVELWRQARDLPCALHFDTGMNRLGLKPDILETAGEALRKLAPVLVMSHLACADEPDHALNAAQLRAFDPITSAFPDTPASLCNSAGCYLGKAYAHDLTRPGIALYGGSVPPQKVKLRHAVTLQAEILSVFKAKAGETVGYGATFTVPEDMTLATVGLGYADGMLRAASNKLTGWVDGVPCPVVGRISMDLITLDVSKAQRAAKAGTRVEFLGSHAKLEEQAARAGTLGYELLTGLGSRVERVYQ